MFIECKFYIFLLRVCIGYITYIINYIILHITCIIKKKKIACIIKKITKIVKNRNILNNKCERDTLSN